MLILRTIQVRQRWKLLGMLQAASIWPQLNSCWIYTGQLFDYKCKKQILSIFFTASNESGNLKQIIF